MQPFIKWPGGKQEELKVIIPNLPGKINRYIEPFVGGGAVYLDESTKANKYLINDKSIELINLYECIKEQNKEFHMKLEAINRNWKLMEWIVEKYIDELIENYIRFRNDELSNLAYHDLLIVDFQIKSENIIKLQQVNYTIN